MKVTTRQLRRMIIEEIRNVKRKELQESARNRPVRVTPKLLNRIIREEYSAFKNRKRLAEARRRKTRIAEARRRQRRIAEARRRRNNRR